ncbi:hypothetical protein IMG5_115540 [Ichthyophthirius multifiliis]|uniref:50S ribosomal protein L20 n=1 Tax=Ichthyophthirius multifiliis TaxID=5932 RepID=G0QU84_ICHMU|nr:hypothetical protein IMG5_115540 [Ichthyophthirius multifiliis]EGR31221.1 hypothetical protein IMG5_115540 [Ichthyophthirius multifiliis]|eukprot:XP_004034707.1 hypothetical protein IMG5_115540 [Ichthyophthirius multifiliis]
MAGFSRDKYKKLAKGFYGRSKNCIRVMAGRVHKALRYSFRDRKVRRRLCRTSWIQTINAATREHNLPYNRLIWALNQSNIQLNRKILADFAINEPLSFKAYIDEIKIQVKLETKPHKRVIDPLEAYAKQLIIDGELKQTNIKVEEPLPYLFGRREEINKYKEKADQENKI